MAAMNIRDADTDDIIDRGIVVTLCSEGYSVRFVHPDTKESKLMLQGATKQQMNDFCRWLRSYMAAKHREIMEHAPSPVRRPRRGAPRRA